jgi:hypothetical protein
VNYINGSLWFWPQSVIVTIFMWILKLFQKYILVLCPPICKSQSRTSFDETCYGRTTLTSIKPFWFCFILLILRAWMNLYVYL